MCMCLSECEHPQSNVNVYNVGNGHCGAERFIFKIFLVYYVTVYTHRTLRIRHEIGYCVRKPTGDDEDEPLSAGNNYRIDGKYEQITVAGEQKFTTTKNFLFVPFPPLSTPAIRYQLVLMPSFEQCHTSNYERFKFWCRKRDFTLHSPFECFMICLLCAMCVSVECWMMPTLTNINFYHFHSPLIYKNASQCVMDPQLMCFFLLVGFTSSIQRVPSE